jgi:GGDEF domain-containing protein
MITHSFEKNILPRKPEEDMTKVDLYKLAWHNYGVATTDYLMGIGNRFDLELYGESYDPSATYAVIVIDIADFGYLNNHLGQDVGDAVLSLFGNILNSQFRTEDKIVDDKKRQDDTPKDSLFFLEEKDKTIRTGGDEVVIVIDLGRLELTKDEVSERALNIKLRVMSLFEEQAMLLTGGSQVRLRAEHILSDNEKTFKELVDKANAHINVMKATQKEIERKNRLVSRAVVHTELGYYTRTSTMPRETRSKTTEVKKRKQQI